MNRLLDSLGATEAEKEVISSQLAALEPQDKKSEEQIAAEYISPTQEATFETQQVHELARTSLDFLGALASPLAFIFCFPPVFISVWIWLLAAVNKVRAFPQLALGLPRGFGKTTVIKLFVLYCILFTNKKFILIVSNTATLAENIVHDIAGYLDEPNIKKIFGDWRLGITQDTQERKMFGFRGRPIILQGIGAGTSMRGININDSRPDVMIFEDIQSREQADSEKISSDLLTWMVGTAMKAKSPAGCMFLFVANMYPTKWSILRKLKSNPTWTKFIAGGILADGTSLWEELQPIAQLTKEFENDLSMGKPEIFYSEVLNDENAAANNRVDFSKLPTCDIQEGDLPSGNFVIIDPSGMKRKSDETAIGYFEAHVSVAKPNEAAKPVLMQLTADRLSPGDTIRQALKYCLINNCRLVCIESVAYQASLAYWFQVVCTQLGIVGIECVEIYPGGFSKISRILSMFKQYQAGDILVNEDLRVQVHTQISSFNPLKDNNEDDVLDLLVYAPKVLEMYPEFVVSNNILIMQDNDAIPLEYDNSCF
jgi:hypothetical protein